MRQELYISVDVEASAQAPSVGSLLSIGATVVGDTSKRFYVELKPINSRFDPTAMTKCTFSAAVTKRAKELGGEAKAILAALAELGVDPEEAMKRFEKWTLSITEHEKRAVFVGFNAPFDWMWVCDYFLRFLARNPFGHNGLDIKSYYMGMAGCEWHETTKQRIPAMYQSGRRHTHKADDDALEQAEMFAKMRDRRRRSS